jgi:CheY-like chemotaxis protein/HPt (histidine-containing phosphotransfer) domain-containing protein
VTANDLTFLREDRDMAELFLVETLDHLGAIEAGVLALDGRPGDQALLNDIFRPFHTIKGNAGALGLASMQEIAHRVESLLDLARSGRRTIGPTEVDLILRAVDVLTSIARAIRARLSGGAEPDPAPAIEALLASLEAATADPNGPEPGAVAAPGTTPPMGVPTAGVGDDHSTITIDTRKLDGLVNIVGELAAVRSEIQNTLAADAVSGELANRLKVFGQITCELERSSTMLRLVPIGRVFRKIRRVVHDASRKAGKPVELVLEGEDTELDRHLVELITDPLVHMVRNAIDHAIEPAARRRAAGKAPRACVRVSCRLDEGHAVVEVADDGQGLDTEKIRARAETQGLIAPEATLSDAGIHALIFEPGFSTADAVTEISGRGVGMDIVRRNVESLRGAVDIVTSAGRGTTFIMRVPFTLPARESSSWGDPARVPMKTPDMDSARRVAHDLNNVTFVISGYAQRLEEMLDRTDPLREDVQAILAEIPRLTAVAERIRELGHAAPPSVGERGEARRPRILLVEDEPAVRNLLRHTLERRGYQVQTGSTGEEGLALCESMEPPDLLIADLIMPGATGPVIAERLRRRAPGVKVLLMSGYTHHPLLDAAQAAGDPCLMKPFEIARFSETVRRLLEETRAA